MFTDDRAAHIRLTDSPAAGERRRIELNVSREIPRTVNSEVYVERVAAVKRNKKVLANGVRVGDNVSVEQDAVAESALRACHSGRVPNKMLPKLRRNAVNGMTLGHT
ncbi:unannotated protein [freshwater metagenome]|uniref:Unannotated protein n=1 Tax=freshwater metagenome TaxID=449393 RepID=A0A6J6F960_9ZZZZ